jgi:hypothetical protein
MLPLLPSGCFESTVWLHGRHLARKTGLNGASDKEAALVDMVVEGVEVSRSPVLPYLLHLLVCIYANNGILALYGMQRKHSQL